MVSFGLGLFNVRMNPASPKEGRLALGFLARLQSFFPWLPLGFGRLWNNKLKLFGIFEWELGGRVLVLVECIV